MINEPDELLDVWIPENHKTVCEGKPLVEREWAGSQAAIAPTKKVVGLGMFAGSLNEMTREEHIEKLRAMECEVPSDAYIHLQGGGETT